MAFDDNHKQYYYYHEETHESQWERPAWPAQQQATLDTMLPQHAARAAELETAAAAATTATSTATATASAVPVASAEAVRATGAVQTTLDTVLPQHAARAAELESIDSASIALQQAQQASVVVAATGVVQGPAEVSSCPCACAREFAWLRALRLCARGVVLGSRARCARSLARRPTRGSGSTGGSWRACARRAARWPPGSSECSQASPSSASFAYSCTTTHQSHLCCHSNEFGTVGGTFH